MQEPREWRVRTRFREVTIRLARAGGATAASQDTAALLSDLCFELESRAPRVWSTVLEIHEGLRGIGWALHTAPPGETLDHERAARELGSMLRESVGRGELIIAEVRRPEVPEVLAVSDAAASQTGPASDPPPEVETTFVGIRVVDQDGKPISGSHFQIKLANGEVRECYTGFDGRVRVDGIPKGGDASVTFSSYDEVDRGDDSDAAAP
jgi:hypothetical protein